MSGSVEKEFEKSNVYREIKSWGETFYIEMDIKMIDFDINGNGWANILHFTQGNNFQFLTHISKHNCQKCVFLLLTDINANTIVFC